MAKKQADSKTTNSKKTPAKAAEPAKKKGGVKKYFIDLKAQMKAMVWPTKKQVINNTGVVLTFVAVTGLFLFGIDSALTAAIKALLNMGS